MGKVYRQLSIEERTMIQTQLQMGIKPAVIAQVLNRSASRLVKIFIGADFRKNSSVFITAISTVG